MFGLRYYRNQFFDLNIREAQKGAFIAENLTPTIRVWNKTKLNPVIRCETKAFNIGRVSRLFFQRFPFTIWKLLWRPHTHTHTSVSTESRFSPEKKRKLYIRNTAFIDLWCLERRRRKKRAERIGRRGKLLVLLRLWNFRDDTFRYEFYCLAIKCSYPWNMTLVYACFGVSPLLSYAHSSLYMAKGT